MAKGKKAKEPKAPVTVEAVTVQTEMIVVKKMGRPSKYDPTMCDRMVELARLGKSKAQIRRDLGIHHSTWAEWSEKHPDFSAAIKESYELSMAYWEDMGMEGIHQGMRFNATAYIFQVKNRFPREYRDRQEHAVTGANGGPIVQEVRIPNLQGVDPLTALRAFEDFRQSTRTTH